MFKSILTSLVIFLFVCGCSSSDTQGSDGGYDAGNDANQQDGGDTAGDNGGDPLDEPQITDDGSGPGGDDGGTTTDDGSTSGDDGNTSGDDGSTDPDEDPTACLHPPVGTPDIPIINQAGPAPILNGCTLAEASYEANTIEVFTDGLFNPLVESFDISSNGDTYGTLQVSGDRWGIEGSLDVFVDLSIIGYGQITQVFSFPFYIAGFSHTSPEFESDYNQCPPLWLPGQTPYETHPYACNLDTVQVLVTISREDFISIFPPEYQALAELVVLGEMPCLLTLQRI